MKMVTVSSASLIFISGLLCQPSANTPSRTLEGDLDTLASMRAEVDVLIANRNCSNSDQCARQAFGSKSCGGPSTYIVYSKANVDETVLTAKLQEYTDFQESINQYYQLSSDCSIVSLPLVDCDAGTCIAAGFPD